MSYGQIPRQHPDLTRRQIDSFVAATAENLRSHHERAEAERAEKRAAMPRLQRAWALFLAWAHLSPDAVCLMTTAGREFHDWPDGHLGQPQHFVTHYCNRCARPFEI